MTLIRAWVVAGQPGERRSSDGYAEWVRAINGILAVAGIEGTFDADEAKIQAEGTDDQDWADFLTALEKTFGDMAWTVKQVLERVDLHGNGGFGGKTIPLDCLPTELAEKAHRSGSVMMLGKSLGRWLTNRQGRWAGGLTVRSLGKGRDGSAWKIQKHRTA